MKLTREYNQPLNNPKPLKWLTSYISSKSPLGDLGGWIQDKIKHNL